MRRLYEGAWNAGDPEVMDELLDAGFVNHELPDAAAPHRGACKRAVAKTRTAFPHWTTIEDLICEDEKVPAR